MTEGADYSDLAEYENHLKAKGDVSEATIRARSGYLRRLREAVGKSLRELTAGEIEGWLAGLNLAPPSRQTVLKYVRHALKVLNGGEASDLAKRLGKPKGDVVNRPRVRTPKELLTEGEVRQIAAAFTKKDLTAIAALQYGLGARPSDVLRLRRDQLAIKSHQGRRVIEAQIADSKGKPRTAYCAKPWVIEAVETWLQAHPGGELLFPSPQGGARDPSAYRKSIKGAASRAGVEKNVYPYLLRHTRATELYDAPPAVRDAQMGWSQGSPQWANYVHLRTEEVMEAILEREGPPEGTMTEDEAKEILGRLLLKATEEPDFAEKLRGMLGG